MPLFTGQRDISLFRQLNQELINKIIRTEILFYKLIMDESDTNVYGEGIEKTYKWIYDEITSGKNNDKFRFSNSYNNDRRIRTWRFG